MTRTPPSKATALLVIVAAAAAVASCADLEGDIDPSVDAVVAGGTAKGTIPAGLPARELVGLFEDTGATWMKTSGVRVGRALPLLHQGLGQQLGLRRVRRIVGARLHARVRRPALHPRGAVLPDERRGGRRRVRLPVEGAERDDDEELLRRLQDPDAAGEGLRQAGDHLARGRRLRLPRAADRRQQRRLRRDQGQRRRRAGGPAQHRRGLGPGVPAAAQVGRREQRRARHPHLRLGERQGRRLRLTSPIRSSPEVDKVYNFLAPFGLAANVTGATWDVLVGDPLDRDSDYYVLVAGAEPLVGRQRQRLDQLEELQPLRRVGAALEREGARSAGSSGRSRSATRTTATSPTTAPRAPATRTTAPSTSSATAPRTWRSSPTRA